jgi:protein SCO1
MHMVRLILFLSATLLLGVSCGRSSQVAEDKPSNKNASTAKTNQVFEVKGVIKELKSDGKTVEIRHEAVTNYMPAMVMPFEAKNPRELVGLKPGDEVKFRMTVADDDVWIDQIQKLTVGNPNQLPSKAGVFHFSRDVEPLQIGDALPEYHFTNELGQAVSTSQFKGDALGITFIFTRCPLPNFCPKMSSNFQEVQNKLSAMTNGPKNWHLLTISFDPEFDSPEILKAYADRFKADPKHWSFLTGDITEISTMSDQFGQMFWKEEGALNHNLRTAVIDASGRVQKIFQGNNWTTDEMVDEIVKATAKARANDTEALKR